MSERQQLTASFATAMESLFERLLRNVEHHNAVAAPEAIVDPSQLLIYRGELRRLLAAMRSGQHSDDEIRNMILKLVAEHEERKAAMKNEPTP